MYNHFFKRLFDIILSLGVLIILSPLLFAIIIWLKFSNKEAGVFFFQERPGKDEKIFRVIKFKTMNDSRDSSGKLLPDAQRLTRVGKFLRSTSLDEIPQLLNIIKGDMSLIGPRPLLVRYLPYFNERERLRHSVKPGITGWAQVNGRNTVNWNDRIEMDVQYVLNISFLLDLKIIFATIKNVFCRTNIIVDPESIMKNFDDERKF